MVCIEKLLDSINEYFYIIYSKKIGSIWRILILMILAIRNTCLTWSALRHYVLAIFFTKDKNKCSLRDYTALCCHKIISQSFSYSDQRKLEWIVKFNVSQSTIGKRPNTLYLNYTIFLQFTTLYVIYSWIFYFL